MAEIFFDATACGSRSTFWNAIHGNETRFVHFEIVYLGCTVNQAFEQKNLVSFAFGRIEVLRPES